MSGLYVECFQFSFLNCIRCKNDERLEKLFSAYFKSSTSDEKFEFTKQKLKLILNECLRIQEFQLSIHQKHFRNQVTILQN